MLKPFVSYLTAASQSARSHEIFFYSSALSFQVVLCLIPTVFLVMWALGTFLSRETLLKQLETIITFALPQRPRSGDDIKEMVLDRARVFTQHRRLFGVVGFVGFFWTSLALIGTLRNTIFHVVGIDVKRPFLRRTIYDLRMLLIAGFFFTASTVVTTLFSGVRQAAMQLPPGEMRFTLVKVGLPAVSAFGLTVLLYFSIYRFLSFGKLKSAPALFGAFWAAVLYEVAKNFFALYITKIGNLGEVYGALEIGIGLLLWIFYSTCVFIFGVELAIVNSKRKALLMGAPA